LARVIPECPPVKKALDLIINRVYSTCAALKGGINRHATISRILRVQSLRSNIATPERVRVFQGWTRRYFVVSNDLKSLSLCISTEAAKALFPYLTSSSKMTAEATEAAIDQAIADGKVRKVAVQYGEEYLLAVDESDDVAKQLDQQVIRELFDRCAVELACEDEELMHRVLMRVAVKRGLLEQTGPDTFRKPFKQ
jgi:hypothetical protein